MLKKKITVKKSIKTIFFALFTFSIPFFFFHLHSSEPHSIDEDEAMVTNRNIRIMEGDPVYLEDHRQRVEEIWKEDAEEESGDASTSIQKKSSYLFKREVYCINGCPQNFEVSLEVFNHIKSARFEKVDFNEEVLYPFDEAGTCSAMALDFLSRYISECSDLSSSKAIKAKVRNFKPFYRGNMSTYSSRQASYNTIMVDRETSLTKPELMKLGKIQSLANFHYLKLQPATKSIETYKILAYSKQFKSIIKSLPIGNYLIRAIAPGDNEKMEYYGHTMVLIKGKHLSLYYDNSDGAVDITDDVPGYVKSKLVAWGIPEIRIYRAEHDPSDPYNVSVEKSNGQ